MTEARALVWMYRLWVALLCGLEISTLVAGMTPLMGAAWVAWFVQGLMMAVLERTA